MSRLAALLASFLLLATMIPGRAGEPEFIRIWPGWKDAAAFDRISDYFGRGENTSGQVILRTQPDTRAGYYFLVRLNSATAVADAKFEVSVIRPDAPEPKVFSFPAAVSPRETVYQLGLTGAAWPGGKKANPVAWRLALVAADGRVLAEHKSFLWEKPAK